MNSTSKLYDTGEIADTRFSFHNNSLCFNDISSNAYFISAIADLLHQELIKTNQSFSLETVMSHPQKIELLNNSLRKGFRPYLYYVATEDPEINISRVQTRVKEGGHDVPKDKIISRYYRSLDNLIAAIGSTSRSFIFDNSGAQAIQIAEIVNGKEIEIMNSNIPHWFKHYVLEKGVRSFS